MENFISEKIQKTSAIRYVWINSTIQYKHLKKHIIYECIRTDCQEKNVDIKKEE